VNGPRYTSPMISRAPRNWLAAVSAAAVAALAAGQAPPTPTAADAAPVLPPRYEVELIVFANRRFDPTEERFDATLNGLGAEPLAPLAEPPVFDETAFGQRGPGAAPPPALDAALLDALRVRPLRPEELRLGGEYRKLAANSGYAPLLHTGWVQPGLPESEAPVFDLATLGVWNPRGTVRVHLIQFLHITLDLTYEAAASGATPLGVESPPGAAPPLAFGDGLDELSGTPRYRLTATRRVRSGELHYFDHPAFGVLVRITPVPAPGANSSGRRPAA
jgi:hypothetical protein